MDFFFLCGVPICGSVLCFVFLATISAFVSRIRLSSWSESALFLFYLSFDVACCVIFLYVCVVAVCSLSRVTVWLLWCIGCGSEPQPRSETRNCKLDLTATPH